MNQLLCLILCFSSMSLLASKETKYKTFFGECPSRTAGNLTFKLLKDFEKNKSLYDLKKVIKEEKIQEKYFISDYKVKYHPVTEMLSFVYDCSAPLLKVHLYKEDGAESYSALLVENGRLLDPTYEVLLRQEKKLKGRLASMAFPVSLLKTDLPKKISGNVTELKSSFKRTLSELIVSEEQELTVIMSNRGRPTSAFLGNGEWDQKFQKLEQIMGYMKKKKKYPSIVNLTNPKKVVVKFSGKL